MLVVPGDQFGMDGYLRIGVGERTDYVMAGLERVRAAARPAAAAPAPPGDGGATAS